MGPRRELCDKAHNSLPRTKCQTCSDVARELRPHGEKHDVGGSDNPLVVTSNSYATMKRRQASRNFGVARRQLYDLEVVPGLDQASDDALRDCTRSDKPNFM